MAATAAPRQQGAARPTRKNAGTPVEAQLSVRTIESTVRLTLHVVNTGKKRVELAFPSGQTHDFVILDSLGREVWRWANGRMFTQTFQNRLLSGGETFDVDGVWQPDKLAPGRYVARAILVSQNYPLVQQMAFTITPSTLASR